MIAENSGVLSRYIKNQLPDIIYLNTTNLDMPIFRFIVIEYITSITRFFFKVGERRSE